MRRNPIAVQKRDKRVLSRIFGVPDDAADYYTITATDDAGIPVVVLHLYDYEDGTASIELVETPKDRRNLGNYLLPVMRKAFAFAKNELSVGTLSTQACHRGIYNFAVRFRTPDWVRPNAVMVEENFSASMQDEMNYTRGGIMVPIEKLPDPQTLWGRSHSSLSDSREHRDSIVDGRAPLDPRHGYAPGEYFTSGDNIYWWDEHFKDHRVLGVMLDIDYHKHPATMRYLVFKEVEPKTLGKFLPDTMPLDDEGVDATKLPMLNVSWFL